MTESNDESKQVGIPDEALPADLVPGEDNPLAEGLPPGETVEGLMGESDDAAADDGDGQDGPDSADGKDSADAAYAPAEGSGTDGERADPPPPEESAEAQET